MKIILSIGLLAGVASAFSPSLSFHALQSRVQVPPGSVTSSSTILRESVEGQADPATVATPGVKELGLLTFDLDDTLYPIDQVVKAANGKFDYTANRC